MAVKPPAGQNSSSGNARRLSILSRIMIVLAIAGLLALVLILFTPFADAVIAAISLIAAAVLYFFPVLKDINNSPHLSRPATVIALFVLVVAILVLDLWLASKAPQTTSAPTGASSAIAATNLPNDGPTSAITPVMSPSRTPTTTATPEENKRRVEIFEDQSEELFDGELTISVRQVGAAWVTAAISSVGYPSTIIELAPVGYSVVYVGPHKFEVLVSDLSRVGAVTFRVTRLDEPSVPVASPTVGRLGIAESSSPTLSAATQNHTTPEATREASQVATPSATSPITNSVTQDGSSTGSFTTTPTSTPESALATRAAGTSTTVAPISTPVYVDTSTLTGLA
jgi:hypothetical protein